MGGVVCTVFYSVAAIHSPGNLALLEWTMGSLTRPKKGESEVEYIRARPNPSIAYLRPVQCGAEAYAHLDICPKTP